MKKKLLTVLLAAVMVFGVFSLTACGNSTNPDDSYNYYTSKYEVEGDVNIQAATFQGVYKMFTTAGKYLIYVDSEDSGAAARFQDINKLAKDWNVTIYHFNPDLSGGYAADDTSAQKSNILVALEGKAAASQLKTVQDTFFAAANKSLGDVADHTLLAVTGAAPTAALNEAKDAATLSYKGGISAANTVADGAKSIAAIATRKPSYAQYEENGNVFVPAAYNTSNINTLNLFADGRLHMYNEDSNIDEFTAEKTDVYVTVANYAMFADLLANNTGYFAVFFGGTWCPNTQAIAKLTDEIAKDYGISKIYFFDPRLDDGTKPFVASVTTDDKGDNVATVVPNSGYLASNLNTRTSDADTDAAYNFNFLYGRFLGEYLPTYASEWNYGVKLSITVNGAVVERTRMCVPNMMMFNGEADGKATLAGLAEAEYSWANTSVEGSAEYVEWSNAIKTIFDTNPYARYAPVIVIEETPDAGTAGGTTGGSTGSAGGGASDGGC